MSKHKEWRKHAKKHRRKRIRQKIAKARDAKLKEEEEQLLNDSAYQSWLHEEEILEKLKSEAEQGQHDEEEEAWLRRELFAQQLFRMEQKRRQEIEKAEEEKRLKIKKEFEEMQRIAKQKIEEKKRREEENLRRHKMLLEKIKEYVETGNEMPDELKESADTNPSRELCPFFMKMSSCRFGDKCSRNHSRPGISKILLLPHFFNHILLEQSKSTEYGNDIALEFSERELYNDYKEFFEDVVPELEKYGKLQSFRTSKNYEPHLRGSVYVEFEQERDALRAYLKLQGRYYAGKRMNVQFANIPSWKAAICGLSLSRKCPKGKNCNFLHVFRNPQNKYSMILPNGFSRRIEEAPSTNRREFKHSPSWNNFEDNHTQRTNWRWSETPERILEVENVRKSEHGERRSTSKAKRYRTRSRSLSPHPRESHKRKKRRSRSTSRDKYLNKSPKIRRREIYRSTSQNRSTSSRKNSKTKILSERSKRKSKSFERSSNKERSRSHSSRNTPEGRRSSSSNGTKSRRKRKKP